MQREICKFLGPEASFEPETYNGITGYIVDAYRPFTPEMLADLRALSEEYTRETREMVSRGYQGIPYRETQTIRRLSQDYTLLEPPVEDPFASWPGHSVAASDSPYLCSTSHFPDGASNPSSANTYGHGPKYPPDKTYPMHPGLPDAASYPSARNQTTLEESLGPLNVQANPYCSEVGYPRAQSYPPKLANFHPNASQPCDSIAAHSGSMSAADNRVEFLIEAPQAGPDFHDDDDESEWSGFSSSDDNMVRSKTIF